VGARGVTLAASAAPQGRADPTSINTPPMSQDTSVSKGARWTSYVLSALPFIALTMSGIMKLMKSPDLVKSVAQFGISEPTIAPIGVVEIACAVIYIIPRTSVLGAILVTGYMGGATFACYRVGQMWWPGVLVGVLAWGGLYLRDTRVRQLVPLRK
jgi:hypothetical protein